MVLSTIFMILIIQSTPLANNVQDLIEQIIINIIIVYGQHAYCLHYAYLIMPCTSCSCAYMCAHDMTCKAHALHIIIHQAYVHVWPSAVIAAIYVYKSRHVNECSNVACVGSLQMHNMSTVILYAYDVWYVMLYIH